MEKGNLPLIANEMKAWACFLIVSGKIFSQFLFRMGSLVINSSRKSNGVTQDTSHFKQLSTKSSVSCKYMKEKKLENSNARIFLTESKSK